MLGSLFDFCSIYVPLFSLGFQKLLQEVIEGVGAGGGTVRASLARPRWRAVEGWTLAPHPPARGWWVGGRVVAPHAARGDTR